jgi:CRP/FNR family transcriptional regulator
MPDPARFLRRRAPWDALGEAEFQRAVRAMRPRRAGKGESLFARGEPFRELFVVATGRVKVELLGRDGREQILSIVTPGASIAEMPLDASPLDDAGDDARHLVSAVALEDVLAWALPRRELEALLGENPAFARAWLETVARRVRALVELIEGLALKGVPERLAAFLLAHARREGAAQGKPFAIERTLAVETVAGRLGTVREEVQRALRLLADEGILELSRKEIVVLDLERLERASWEPLR